MEALGVAASVIAVIDLAAKVSLLCSQYLRSVLRARDDITRLQREVKNLETTLRHAQQLFRTSRHQLPTFANVAELLEKCTNDLEQLRTKLDPSPGQGPMRRIELRAIKWPFGKQEVEAIITSLKSHQNGIMFGLQIDQSNLLIEMKNALDNLSSGAEVQLTTAYQPQFILPFPRDPHFVERSAVLAWVEDQYNGTARRIGLVGMGGFGKSQIAIEFAHRVHIASPDTSVFWIHGSNEATFEESYRSLAETLLLPTRHDPDVNIHALVCSWLQRDDIAPWLIVLDNADDLNTFFSKRRGSRTGQEPLSCYLPKTGNGKVLVTSRNLNVAERLVGCFDNIRKVLPMDKDEATQILRNKLDTRFEKDAAGDLVALLDFIPLAVNQAAAYIKRRTPRMSTRSYVDSFCQSESKKRSLLSSDSGDLRRHEGVSNSVVLTWQITFEQLREERPAAANLLLLMSFFHSQNIPEYMLCGYTDDGGEIAFEDDMDALHAYSLVTSATPGCFDMHSLVQFCTRAWIVQFDSHNFARLKSLFLLLCAKHFPSGEFETWGKCQVLLPHIQSLLYEKPVIEADIINWNTLLTNMSWYMLMVGNYSAAENTAEQAVLAGKAVLGDEHPATLTSIINLGSTYWKQGRLDLAESIFTQVMETSRRELGDEHLGTLTNLNNLASTYWQQGRLDEAESLFIRVTEARRRILGDDHLSTLMSMSNLASTYLNQGQWTRAEELFAEVINISLTALGDENPSTLTSMSNLALTYQKQGRLAEAESLELFVMKTRKRVLGDWHPDTLGSMNSLAFIFRALNRPIEGLNLLRDCVGHCQRVFGAHHPNTIHATHSLRLWEQGEAGGPTSDKQLQPRHI